MPSSTSVASWVERFRRFLVRRRFGRFALKHYLSIARGFLWYLGARRVDPAAAQPSHICSYLKVQLARYRRRQRREPLDLVDWRAHHTAPIHQFFVVPRVSGHRPRISGDGSQGSQAICAGSASRAPLSSTTASWLVGSSPSWSDGR